MRWFRSNIWIGSRVALFAMALQIALTFGHVHPDGFPPGTAKAQVTDQSAPATPNPINKTSGTVDFDCPICALIQLASTSAPSVAPHLGVPTAFVVVRPATDEQPALLASPHRLFQARGPPAV